MKVLVVTNIPNPYRIPLFNLLQDDFSKNQHELLVLFGTDTYKRRKFTLDLNECRFRYHILDSHKYKIASKEGIILTYHGIYNEIRKFSPDKIIVSGFSIATLKLFFFSFLGKIPYYIWSGSIVTKGRTQSKLILLLRMLLAKRASGFLTYGSRSKEYLISLGIKPEKISIAINTVDVSFFKTETEKLRSALSVKKRKKFIYIGYLTKGKRVDLILNAIYKLKQQRDDFFFQIIGDGNELGNLKSICNELDLNDRVQFTGFIQKEKLPQHLADAYAFLFASEYDIWGLVMVEAMAAGIPCIASKYAGATIDLIENNINGYEVDYENSENISSILGNLLNDQNLRDKLALNASKKIFNEITLQKSAEGFYRILGI